MVPNHLQDQLNLYRPCRSLRSGNTQLLKTQSYNVKSYGFRTFSICAPQLWNAFAWTCPDVIFKSFQYLSVLSHSGLFPWLKRTFQCIKCYKNVWKTVQCKWSSEWRSLSVYRFLRGFKATQLLHPHWLQLPSNHRGRRDTLETSGFSKAYYNKLCYSFPCMISPFYIRSLNNVMMNFV